jgi:hypothetical protein
MTVPDEMDLLRMFRDEMPGPSTDAWARARAAVAAARSEEIPARSRNVKRAGWRRRFPLAVVTSVAAAAALVAVLLTVPLGGRANREQIQTEAYIARVQHALASQAGRGLVGYARTALPPGTVAEPEAGNWKSFTGGGGSPSSALAVAVRITWTYQNHSTLTALAATGRPLATEEITANGRHGTTTVTVDYHDRTWWQATATSKPGARPPAQPRCSAQNFIPINESWQAVIRKELSCGAYTEDGRQRVDGIDAIKLAGSNGVVLWIDPRNYMPVRQAGPGPIVTNFRWLQAVPASLANLKVAVPAGFRQVAPPRP